MFKRVIEDQIIEDLKSSNKIVILYGPRQVGKTTLVRGVIKKISNNALEVNADRIEYREALSSSRLSVLKDLVGDHKLLFIDEAQNIENIGINLKILHDDIPDLQIIVTGSSSFDLANKIQEPLTGRTWTHYLYPVSIFELAMEITPFQIKNDLESYLLYGMYPEVLNANTKEQKIRTLRELASSYLYKDIFQLSGIRNADKINRLLKLLALQVGSLVSIHELGKSLEMSNETVNNYIQLLEKSFIIFRLGGFSRNLRKEITKMDKIYFYDSGIRNMLLENFNSMESRVDKGAIWENFLIAERIKKCRYSNIYSNTYFWRTYTGAELDYVEEREGKLYGFEIKWKDGKAKPPATWIETYSNAEYKLINKDNFLEFVG